MTAELDTQPDLEPGDRVGAYRIVSPLGQGGMGMVYRAVHALLDRPAAIKVLHPAFGHSAMVVDRFLNEARATTAIRHPGIVQIYDYGYTESGRAYIAMELLEGHALTERIARAGRLGTVEALCIARQIAAPLAVAHECGVVHRDLKPDNIFLTPCPDRTGQGIVRILDFGIAKLASSASGQTTVGVVLGTPAYMSPEQSLAAAHCDHRTDLYALGCVLFEMLAGRRPFTGSVVEMMAAHLTVTAPDVRDHVAVPAPVARLVAQLLAKAPADRPAHAHAVIAAIDAVIGPRQTSSVTAVRPPVRVRRIRRRFANGSLAAASVLGVACSCAGAWQWVQHRHDPISLAPTAELHVSSPERTGDVHVLGSEREAKLPPPPPPDTPRAPGGVTTPVP